MFSRVSRATFRTALASTRRTPIRTFASESSASVLRSRIDHELEVFGEESDTTETLDYIKAKGLKLADGSSPNTATFTREVDNKKITLTFTEFEEEDENEEDSDNEEPHSDAEYDSNSDAEDKDLDVFLGHSFDITIKKPTGSILSLGCFANGNGELFIDRVSALSDSQLNEAGLEVRELSPENQDAFEDALYDYVGELGIDDTMAQFVQKYAAEMRDSTYEQELKSISKFLAE